MADPLVNHVEGSDECRRVLMTEELLTYYAPTLRKLDQCPHCDVWHSGYECGEDMPPREPGEGRMAGVLTIS